MVVKLSPQHFHTVQPAAGVEQRGAGRSGWQIASAPSAALMIR
jgi:hypothetical protein